MSQAVVGTSFLAGKSLKPVGFSPGTRMYGFDWYCGRFRCYMDILAAVQRFSSPLVVLRRNFEDK